MDGLLLRQSALSAAQTARTTTTAPSQRSCGLCQRLQALPLSSRAATAVCQASAGCDSRQAAFDGSGGAQRLTAAGRRGDCSARAAESSTAARTAEMGDTVTVHFAVIGENGEQLESSRKAGQPLTFEVGASEVVGNELLQAFDGGVRGLAIGATRRVQLEPLQAEWDQDLLFSVPADHPEVARLQGKFRSSGGLQEGMIVELANGAQAQVLKISPEGIVLDCNGATAGRRVSFDLELVGIE